MLLLLVACATTTRRLATCRLELLPLVEAVVLRSCLPGLVLAGLCWLAGP